MKTLPSRSPAPRRLLVIISLGLLLLQVSANPAREASPFGDLAQTMQPSGFSLEDRLTILNLIHLYSHLADGLHTQHFGEFFTVDAVFDVAPFAGPGVATPSQSKSKANPPDRQRVGKGRAEIIAALRPRHAEFRREGIQRRHFLTNPVVWDQTDDRARVAVYLQLRSSRQGGPSEIGATGRYEGVVVKTLDGWRMAEWTIHSDQVLN